jgi:outer membrane protein OmpA-like peptidoglycan-associated protein
VQGDDTFRLRTSFDDLVVRIDRVAGPPDAEQRALGRRAMSDLRFGVEGHDPGTVATAQKIVRALDGGSFRPFELRELGPSLTDSSFETQLLRRLEEEFERGRLVVEREPIASLSERRDLFDPPIPPLPPAPRESKTHTFEVRFVDEVGKAISGIDAEFTADGAQTRPTNAAGLALLEGIKSASANVAILDPEALSKVLDPRWVAFRPGKPAKESNITEVVFHGGPVGPFDLKAELPNTVVIKPPLGKLFAELFDKTGRVLHANRTYQITGPQSFEGTTDDDGRLLHEDVFPGDYQLSLALDFFEEDPDHVIDIVDCPLVVLDAGTSEPEVRMLGVVPRSIMARLNLFFNTNKAFLLPTALPSVLELRRLYVDNAPCKLLVVGHADTRAGNTFNDNLALERAKATIAYLQDDVEAWFKFYSHDDPKKCWGRVEDRLMITALPDFTTKPKGEDPVRFFQRTRGLKVDGTAGKDTRHALIQEYMSLDGSSLREFVGEIEPVAHGCGENFPLDDSGQELDDAPADEKRDRIDRRVELFFFDPEFGITPPAPGPTSKPGSPEYPLWRKRVESIVELDADDPEAARVTFVEMTDAHFRTDSAVVMPEGESPNDDGNGQAATAVGVIATALRFVEANPAKTLLVAGHTDTMADDAHNQALSEDRAKVALAMLRGGSDQRDAFSQTCDSRHTNRDINQILAWAAREFSDLGFDCDPGKLTDTVDSAKVKKFQVAYNNKKAQLNASPSVAVLDPDGSFGPLTWGAVFDCYDLALARELGETTAGVAKLRAGLKFADPNHESLGFGEHFPIEELGVDQFRSQTNRRVEFVFFDPGEEPDLAHAADDPETSELYLPGTFVRSSLPPLLDAKTHTFDFRVHDGANAFIPGAAVTVSIAGQILTVTADAQGIASFTLPPICPESVTLTWVSNGQTRQKEVFLECVAGQIADVAVARLENLGYPARGDLHLANLMFQLDFQLSPREGLNGDGTLPQIVLDELVKIWDQRNCDAALPPPPAGS